MSIQGNIDKMRCPCGGEYKLSKWKCNMKYDEEGKLLAYERVLECRRDRPWNLFDPSWGEHVTYEVGYDGNDQPTRVKYSIIMNGYSSG